MGMLCIAVSIHGEAFGGGPLGTNYQSDCITAWQRVEVAPSLEHSGGIAALSETLPQPYRFQPLAGTVWQDRFILNFYDNDPSSGILDWDCSHGLTTPIMRRTFSFAALLSRTSACRY